MMNSRWKKMLSSFRCRLESICRQRGKIGKTFLLSLTHSLFLSVGRQWKTREERKNCRWSFLFDYFSWTLGLFLCVNARKKRQIVTMFWVLYALFSMFRTHRNRIYWRNGKLHIVKPENARRPAARRVEITAAEEERIFRRDLRQWLMFYAFLFGIIIAVLIHRFYSTRKSIKH